MATFNPRRFAQPDTLKLIAHNRLVEFLQPFATYLVDRGLTLPSGNGAEIDYGKLSMILMSPDENTPSELADALYYVHEMATRGEMDVLLEAAKEAGFALDDDSDTSPADVAVYVWLKDRDLLEKKHAEMIALRPKSFEYFAGKVGGPNPIPNPTAKKISDIQAHLDAWFLENKRGDGSKVFVFPDEANSKAWILVRHGKPLRREGTHDGGKSSSIYFRPEVHDVLIYNALLDEIAIVRSGTKGEKNLYREAFGLHLFGDADYFPGGDKFTLQPLLTDGVDSLVCTDIEGIEWIKLREVQRYWGGTQKEIETRRADDLFAAMEVRDASFSAKAKLTSAVFTVKFESVKTPRSVTIRPKNVAMYTRDEDSVRVEKWLTNRGFASAPKLEENNLEIVENVDAALAYA
ncbi:MAG TPA: hypothetical protein ENI69_01500 [Rhodospirillales bacterium]|nr:hypothetical protein [Rhodospirillales bacterium]